MSSRRGLDVQGAIQRTARLKYNGAGPWRTVAPLPEDTGDSALLNEIGCRGGLRHTRREAR
jgi:hypothetical protein